MTEVLEQRTESRADDEGERTALVHVAIALYRRLPFHEVSLQRVADEAAVSLAHLQQHLPTWNDLILTTVQVWYADRMAPIMPIAEQHGAVAFLRGIVSANIADPALMRFLSATVNLAAIPDHPLAPDLQRSWLRFHAQVQRTLMHDIAVGREPDTMDPARGAEQLIALYEGLQLQSMVRPHMQMLEAYDRATTRLREGWSRTYSPPIWEI